MAYPSPNGEVFERDFYLDIKLIYWIIIVSKFWIVVTYLSFELPLLSQYNYGWLNHECFKHFSRGATFVVWVIPFIVVIMFLFLARFWFPPHCARFLTEVLPMQRGHLTRSKIIPHDHNKITRITRCTIIIVNFEYKVWHMVTFIPSWFISMKL